MPGTRLLLRIAGIALLITAAGYITWHLTRSQPLEVELATVSRGAVEATVVNTRAGTIKACRRAKLSPQAGGQIIRMEIREGDRIKKDQVLLELWNTDLQAQHDLAKQQLATAESRRQESCILADNAQREYIRTQQLVEKGFVSVQRADDASATAKANRAACAATGAEVRRARAQIAVSQANLDRTQLIAPFAGVIAQITGELGEYVTPSPPGIPTPPAVDLIDDSCLYVSAPMDEVDAPKIRVGQVARITLDALPGQIFEGKVRRIAPYVTEVEKQARTVDVEAEFANPDQAVLLVGYSADIEAIIDHRENVLRVPTQVIRQGNKVWVLDQDSRLEEQTLKTGLANWAYTEVLEGLSEGDQVLLSGDSGEIKTGTQVTPKSPQP
ncbi:HlyD family secretion protein [Nitrosomonas eutropha]|uniref:efflux RND transporter periplasmic adaptor subunit n=1 Tax=Nitrosomonas TaxID=914 RepID=UPI000898FC45|nr:MULTISPECIES: efflux RND transporter periplasmic adaptor subunit [Nitrosomonas]MXS79881.1 efflux RND transporter periplasmic adaptor subunit [Nitrosomonas sp. GH22]SDW93864.1 HlyD family secretion protein [Nitrosomonas eutropha]